MNKNELRKFFYYKNENFNLAIESYNCKILERLFYCENDDHIFYESSDYLCKDLRTILEKLTILLLIKHLEDSKTAKFLEDIQYIDVMENLVYKERQKWDRHIKKIDDSLINEILKNKNRISNECDLHGNLNNYVMEYELWFETVFLIEKSIKILKDISIEGEILPYKNLIFLNMITHDNKLNEENLKKRNNSIVKLKETLIKNDPNYSNENKFNKYTKKMIINFIKKFYWGNEYTNVFPEPGAWNTNTINLGNKYLIQNILKNKEEKIAEVSELSELLAGNYINNEIINDLKKVIKNNEWTKVLEILNHKINNNDITIFKSQDITLEFLDDLYYFIINLSKQRNNTEEEFIIFDKTIDGYTKNLQSEANKRIEIIEKKLSTSYKKIRKAQNIFDSNYPSRDFPELKDYTLFYNGEIKEKSEKILLEFKAVFIEYWYLFEHKITLNKFLSEYKNFWYSNPNQFNLNEKEWLCFKKFINYKEQFNGQVIKKWGLNIPQNNIKSYSKGINNYINIPFLKFQLKIFNLKYNFINSFIRDILNNLDLIQNEKYKLIISSDLSRITHHIFNNMFSVLPEIEEFTSEGTIINRIRNLFLSENILHGWTKWQYPINSQKENGGWKFFNLEIAEDFYEKIIDNFSIKNIIKEINYYKKELNNEYFSYQINDFNECVTNKNLKLTFSKETNNFENFWIEYIKTIKNDYKKLETIINSAEWKKIIKEIIEIRNKLENL